MMNTLSPPRVSLQAIGKSFPGVRALDNVTVEVAAGQIVAIVGENGAGKSTLLKILGGIHQPDQGHVFIDGKPADLSSVRRSMDLGISLIHQELNLADNLSIAENIFLGKQPSRGSRFLPFTNRSMMDRESSRLLDLVGLKLSPRTLVGSLSVGQCQLVEVAKALSQSARVLIFDEPTSSLSVAESGRLMEQIKQLRNQGTGILYVSHRLNEVCQLADKVIVLRDGQHVGTLVGENISEKQMISLMVGRDIKQYYHRSGHEIDRQQPALAVQQLRYRAAASPISFSVGRGEIVGFAGLVGAGRTELARVLFGIDPILGGQFQIDGRPVRYRTPVGAVKAGMAMVPEDRKAHGLVLPMPLCRNIGLTVLSRLGSWPWYNRLAETQLARRLANELTIHAASLQQTTGLLSGGNQQKVVLAKWLASEPRVFVLDEPTRGVDVGAKSEIYRLIFELSAKGVGIMMISSEMEEIIGVSDRVIVMHEGSIQGELTGDQINEEAVMSLAIGAAA